VYTRKVGLYRVFSFKANTFREQKNTERCLLPKI
jgi:hypothetical protein